MIESNEKFNENNNPPTSSYSVVIPPEEITKMKKEQIGRLQNQGYSHKEIIEIMRIIHRLEKIGMAKNITENKKPTDTFYTESDILGEAEKR